MGRSCCSHYSDSHIAKQGGGWLAAVAVVIILACIDARDGHDESEEEEVPLFKDIDIERMATMEVA